MQIVTKEPKTRILSAIELSPVVIHVPHASVAIPAAERGSFLCDLSEELHKMTDHYCDEIFCTGNRSVVFPVSRLVCDPERFRDDAQESMCAVGMGAVYTRTHDGGSLRNVNSIQRERILKSYYDPHHAALAAEVKRTLDQSGRCLIIDGHSFFPEPLPYESDQSIRRPDFCIGTDPYHTPDALAKTATDFLGERDYSVAVNAPFAGALVPLAYYRKNPRVCSIMIEINRRLYMHEDGSRSESFQEICGVIRALINTLESAENQIRL